MGEEEEVVPIEDAGPSAPAEASAKIGKKRSRRKEEPLPGLDAWAAEFEAAVPPASASAVAVATTPAAPTEAERNGADEEAGSGGGDAGRGAGGASTSQAQQRPQQYGKKRRKCFRYGNYHRYYGYRVGETLEDHRIPHFRREWFEGKRQGNVYRLSVAPLVASHIIISFCPFTHHSV